MTDFVHDTVLIGNMTGVLGRANFSREGCMITTLGRLPATVKQSKEKFAQKAVPKTKI